MSMKITTTVEMPFLSPAEAEAAAFYEDFEQKHGRGPSQREMADALNIRIDQAKGRIKQIAKKGAMVRQRPHVIGGAKIVTPSKHRIEESKAIRPVFSRCGNNRFSFDFGGPDGKRTLSEEDALKVLNQMHKELSAPGRGKMRRRGA